MQVAVYTLGIRKIPSSSSSPIEREVVVEKPDLYFLLVESFLNWPFPFSAACYICERPMIEENTLLINALFEMFKVWL